MLQAVKQNYHHSILPKIGAVGYLVDNKRGEKLYWKGKQLYQVLAFPLCDNVSPFSRGIHTAYFKSLKNGIIEKMSGFYFESIEV